MQAGFGKTKNYKLQKSRYGWRDFIFLLVRKLVAILFYSHYCKRKVQFILVKIIVDSVNKSCTMERITNGRVK